MIEIKLPSQRFYLAKDNKQNFYIDLHKPLPEHQLNGIRFLYRQFKKKNPGVILNDPSGYGKCLQTVLFLNAMRSALSKPIFVMCEEYDVENWKEHFQKWTDFDDLAIVSTNPFAKSMVYINTVKEAYTFCRRPWSVVIVHDNTFAKEKLQSTFKADFKIWVTSVNMKENLRSFSLIYEWLQPNSKVNIEDFAANRNNPKDVIDKSILLDAFFEDVVIRRNDFLTPFTSKSRVSRQCVQANIESPPKATRKNKDPTGTKVKRSRKRKIDDESDVIVDVPISNEEHFTNRNEVPDSTENTFDFIINNKNNDDINKNNDKNNEMDIESFIRDQDPIEAEGYDTTSEQSSANAKSDTSEFQNAMNEMVDQENKSDYASKYQVTAIDDGKLTTDRIQFTVTEDSDNTQSSFSINANNGRDITIKDCNLEQQDNDSEKSDIVKQKGLSTDFIVLNKSDNIDNKNELADIYESNIDKKQDKTEICDVNKKLDNITNDSDRKEDVGSCKDNPNVKKNIDDILAELEEKTLKKFKGSFLDSMFKKLH